MSFSHNFQDQNRSRRRPNAKQLSVEFYDRGDEEPFMTIDPDYDEDHRLQKVPRAKLQLLGLIVTCGLRLKGIALMEDAARPGRYMRVGTFTMRMVSPEAASYLEDFYFGDHGKWKDEIPADYQARVRSGFWGENVIREIVLV
ncbi:tol protein [Colletotrichum asianum]|uniref:Tol protein n=1 Tax=Colletotrichum asianum TaxID=702518 RepID=A0A8H3ZMG1_9PEZI|nr:tol protein [Colletotrichum asianum]